MERKLVVLGIPWEIDSDGLKDYMSKFGDLEDCIVMKDRSTGRSRGFGYVTFASSQDAKDVLKGEHSLGNRVLEVKVATPKEEMRQPSKKATRIFVARIPPSVSESDFRSHFERYGEITDLYMPKDHKSKQHRGIGFITFATSDSVEDLMEETHELGGTTVAVDRATPKDDDPPPPRPPPRAAAARMMPRPPVAAVVAASGGGFGGGPGGYGAYDAYISAATRYAALGAPTLYDNAASFYGRPEPTRGIGNKIFVGRLPQEATVDDLRDYFGRFGRIQDAYIPKDPKRSGHRGFGFVTFAENGVADRVSRRSHEICGQEVAIDSATPLDEAGPSAGGSSSSTRPEYIGGYGGGPMRTFGRMYGGAMSLDDWGYGMPSARQSRSDWRYRPY